MSTPTPRDELEMAAATPRQLVRTLLEQRVADPPPNAPVHPLDEFLDDIKANDAAELFAGDEEGKAAFLANVDAVRTMRELPSGIAPLIAMVERGTDDQKEWAAGALANLALDDGNSVAIAQAGGVPPLIALVEGGTDGQKERAAYALAYLARDAGNKVAIAQAVYAGNKVAIAQAAALVALAALMVAILVARSIGRRMRC